MGDIQYDKTKIIILGAGGLAREITSWVNNSNSKVDITGYMDDLYDSVTINEFGLYILGKISFDNFLDNQTAICAFVNCFDKERLYLKSLNYKIKFTQFIHDSCIIGDRTSFGIGFLLLPNALISCDVKIGNLVFVNIGSHIGHDVIVGDFTSIMANVDIGGGAQIGKNVFIGSNAVILPGVKIPDNTIVGAGSVVIRSLKQPGTYFGNPAKKIF